MKVHLIVGILSSVDLGWPTNFTVESCLCSDLYFWHRLKLSLIISYLGKENISRIRFFFFPRFALSHFKAQFHSLYALSRTDSLLNHQFNREQCLEQSCNVEHTQTKWVWGCKSERAEYIKKNHSSLKQLQLYLKKTFKNLRNALIKWQPSTSMHYDVILNCMTIRKLLCKTFAHFNVKDGWQCSMNRYLKSVLLLSLQCVTLYSSLVCSIQTGSTNWMISSLVKFF